MMTLRPFSAASIAAVFIIFDVGAPPPTARADASTQFNVFVPPNNITGRDVVLAVTAVNAGTTQIWIVDDSSDSDNDDSVTANLTQGQSQLVWMREGSVNDDAGGKWDGDYFIINANQPVVV